MADNASFSKGNGYSKGDLIPNGNPIILYGRLYTSYQTSIESIDTFVSPKNGSVYSTGYEVIIPASGETAEDIARASAVSTKGIILGGDLNVLIPTAGIDSQFLALRISNGAPQKKLASKAQGKSVVHLHNSDIEELVLSIPKLEEQLAIQNHVSKLDAIITLHQCLLIQL